MDSQRTLPADEASAASSDQPHTAGSACCETKPVNVGLATQEAELDVTSATPEPMTPVLDCDGQTPDEALLEDQITGIVS